MKTLEASFPNGFTPTFNNREHSLSHPFTLSSGGPSKIDHPVKYLSRPKRLSPTDISLSEMVVTNHPPGNVTIKSAPNYETADSEFENTLAGIINSEHTIGERYARSNNRKASSSEEHCNTNITTESVVKLKSGRPDKKSIKQDRIIKKIENIKGEFKCKVTEKLNKLYSKTNQDIDMLYDKNKDPLKKISSSKNTEVLVDKYIETQETLRGNIERTLDNHISDYKRDLSERASSEKEKIDNKLATMDGISNTELKNEVQKNAQQGKAEIDQVVVNQETELEQYRAEILKDVDECLKKSSSTLLQATLKRFESNVNHIKDRFNSRINDEVSQIEQYINLDTPEIQGKPSLIQKMMKSKIKDKSTLIEVLRKTQLRIIKQAENRTTKIQAMMENITNQELRSIMDEQIYIAIGEIYQSTNTNINRLNNLIAQINSREINDEADNIDPTTASDQNQSTPQSSIVTTQRPPLPLTTRHSFGNDLMPSIIVLNFHKELSIYSDYLWNEKNRILNDFHKAICSATNKKEINDQISFYAQEMKDVTKICKNNTRILAGIAKNSISNSMIQSGVEASLNNIQFLQESSCHKVDNTAWDFRKEATEIVDTIWIGATESTTESQTMSQTTQNELKHYATPSIQLSTTDKEKETTSPKPPWELISKSRCNESRDNFRLITPNITTTTEDSKQKAKDTLLDEIATNTRDTESKVETEMQAVELAIKDVLDDLNSFQTEVVQTSIYRIRQYSFFHTTKISQKLNMAEPDRPDFDTKSNDLKSTIDQKVEQSIRKIELSAASANKRLDDIYNISDHEVQPSRLPLKDGIREKIDLEKEKITNQQQASINRLNNYRTEVKKVIESNLSYSDSLISRYRSEVVKQIDSTPFTRKHHETLFESLENELPKPLNVNDIISNLKKPTTTPQQPDRLRRAADIDFIIDETPAASSASQHRGMLFEALSATGSLLSRVFSPHKLLADIDNQITGHNHPMIISTTAGDASFQAVPTVQNTNMINQDSRTFTNTTKSSAPINMDNGVNNSALINMVNSGNCMLASLAIGKFNGNQTISPSATLRLPQEETSALHNTSASWLLAGTSIILPGLLIQVFKHLIAPGLKQSPDACWTRKNIMDIAILQECHGCEDGHILQPPDFYHAVLSSPVLGMDNAGKTFDLDNAGEQIIRGSKSGNNCQFFQDDGKSKKPVGGYPLEFVSILLDTAAKNCLQRSDQTTHSHSAGHAPEDKAMDEELKTEIVKVLPHASPRDQAIIARAIRLKDQQETTWLGGFSRQVWPVNREDQIREMHLLLHPETQSQQPQPDPGVSEPVVALLQSGNHTQAMEQFFQLTPSAMLKSIEELREIPDFCQLDRSEDSWLYINKELKTLVQRVRQEPRSPQAATGINHSEDTIPPEYSFELNQLKQHAWVLMAYQYDIKINVFHELIRPVELQQRIIMNYPDFTAHEARELSQIIPEMLPTKKRSTCYDLAQRKNGIKLPLPYKPLQYRGHRVDAKLAQFREIKTVTHTLYPEVFGRNATLQEDIITSVSLSALHSLNGKNISARKRDLFIHNQLQKESRRS